MPSAVSLIELASMYAGVLTILFFSSMTISFTGYSWWVALRCWINAIVSGSLPIVMVTPGILLSASIGAMHMNPSALFCL
ncbi:MAG: hypothetical protein VW378_06330 [bacterium]